MGQETRVREGKVGIVMALELVDFEEKHINSIVAIEKVSFPTPWSIEAFHHELNDNPFAHYLVALLDGEVIGYGGMWQVLDEAHVTNVAVDIPYRGLGYGRLVLQALAAKALAQGCTKMTLEVRISNFAAQRLYTSLDFIAYGVRKGYYTDTKEDAIIMWKNLI